MPGFLVLILIIVLCLVVVGAVIYALDNLPFIPDELRKIARVLIIVITVIGLCLWIIQGIQSGAPMRLGF